ncbi:OmpW/AlkL family protein [Bacterioplanoides sp.]|uniref:OmpW/AlkL family protein n=1 Tax=Bacterioplanoides sp. TaxID=2066072 RepID=UPI003B00B604
MKLLKTLLASAVAISAMPALSYEAGDFVVKAGIVNVNPKEDNIDKKDLASDVDGQVSDDTQLGLTLTYMVTPKIGVEVLAATPFRHDVTVNGNKIAETKHLPPTISAQYYLLDPASKIQPYVGLGVNHTFFFDEDGAAPHLEKSWGLSYSAGVNYDINERFLANVAVWKLDIDTEINGGPADGIDVEIDPLVFMVGAGMKF